MRLLYSLIWCLALPFVLLRLWLRGKQEPGYRQHIPERLGFYRQRPTAPMIWVHAVSAGETRAAEPLLRALLAQYPDHHILLSHMTATGRSTGGILLKDVQDRVTQVFLPYDIGLLVARFLRHFSPRICVLIETEVWPNLVHQCERHQVPVALVNARLSEKSLKKALRISSLILPAAHRISVVAAQSHPDADRLKALGVQRLQITGNIKFDVNPPSSAHSKGQALRQHAGKRPVLLCGSTRDGEEELILDAFNQWQTQHPEWLLILTPRHPQRFDQVAAMLEARQLRYVRRSVLDLEETNDTPETKLQVILGDSMGEMYMYYAACDIAFIGGSLVPLGGHNLIEACAMGKPVLIGQHTFNFSEITEQAIAAQACIRVADANALMDAAQTLQQDAKQLQSCGNAALTFFGQHQGATARTMAILAPYLNRP